MTTPYSKSVLKWLRQRAMQIKGAKEVRHLYPRAYCIAKPAPLCAIFVVPWMDGEPQARKKKYYNSDIVHNGVENVKVGDWCALAYVVTRGYQLTYAFKLPEVGNEQR